jgi:hypothetical protein
MQTGRSNIETQRCPLTGPAQPAREILNQWPSCQEAIQRPFATFAGNQLPERFSKNIAVKRAAPSVIHS